MSTQSSESAKPDAEVGVIELPGLRPRPVLQLGDTEGDWLCALCLARVANERDRFGFGGKDEFTFFNPAGFRFDIITFSQTHACRETGVPTLEDTWFPDHAWSFCVCSQCGQHLGWYYTGSHSFAGLIKDRIVRSVCIRN